MTASAHPVTRLIVAILLVGGASVACSDDDQGRPRATADGGEIDARVANVGGGSADASAADREAGASDDAIALGARLGEGLVGHWPFDEATGTTAEDSSPNGLHARFIDLGEAHRIPGRLGRALGIPEEYSAVEVPSAPSIARPFQALSIAAWVFIENVAGHMGYRGAILSRQRGNEDAHVFKLLIQNNRISFLIGGAGLKEVAAIPTKRWFHMAGTYDGATMRAYLDGELVGEASLSVTVPAADTPLLLGASRRFNPEHNKELIDESLGGGLDEVVLYDRGLSAQEVKLLAAGLRPLP